MSPLPCTVSGLNVYPVKSCAGIALTECELLPTGLDLDREWMVVDARGGMLTQRRWPRLALVQPRLRSDELVLRAPGMLALHLRLDAVDRPATATVWHDTVAAFDMGALPAQWFSAFLGTPARLVRFDPDALRACDPQWSGDTAATVTFADGFPLLVVGRASLADLNARLAARGAAAVGLERFRANLVVDGLEAYGEDRVARLVLPAGDEGASGGDAVELALVKPCVRCTIPDVDPASAEVGDEPGATLATFRADARMHGGSTFGVNAVVAAGAGRVLRVGQALQAWLR